MIRVDDATDVPKCWLSPEELTQLERTAGEQGWEREIAIQLMGRCSLRASELSYPGDDDLRYSDKGDVWLCEVRGKNTKGGNRKLRDAWMPDAVADDVHKYSRERSLSPSESWVNMSTPTASLGERNRTDAC